MAKDNGGPAFPGGLAVSSAGDLYRSSEYGDGGMSLRDWFAGQYLPTASEAAKTAKEYHLQKLFGGRGGLTHAEITAALAYEMADAMLAERAK